MSRCMLLSPVLLLSLASNGALSATYTTVQEGLYWCSEASTCAWGGAGHPGAADTGVIAHPTTLWGQGATPPAPLVVPLARLDLVAGGVMKIYEGRRLEFGGGTWSGGALDACCNGGGVLNNRGTLEITAATLPAFRNTIENNATLRVANGGALLWDPPSGGGLMSNLSTTATPALIQLDGTGRVGGALLLRNEGIVRKTGAGTSIFTGTLRNLGLSPLYPGRIEVAGPGTLAIADHAGYEGKLISEGGTIEVGAGATFAIRDGGQMQLTPESGPDQVYLTRGLGPGRVRLESGGTLAGSDRLADQSAAAVIDFAPGVFEFAGGNLGAYGLIRNSGEITVVGTGPKLMNYEVDNAGTMRLPSASMTLDGTLRLLPGSLLEASGTSHIDGAGARLVVDGTLRKSAGSGTLTLSNAFQSFRLEGAGRIEVLGGVLLADNYAQFYGTLELAQATISSTNPGIYLREEATLSGVGTVHASQLEQRGRIQPGAPFGVLTITGTLRQDGFNPPVPTTHIEVGGPTASTEYDQIQVGGDLRPFGILRVNFRDGYGPPPGSQFDLITLGGQLTGPLTQYQVIIEGLAPGFQWSLTLSPQNTVRLTALNQGISLGDLIFRHGFEP